MAQARTRKETGLVKTAGWYVLGLHDVAWEESPYLSGLGSTMPPDTFATSVRLLADHATLVSVDEGFRKWQAGALDRPYVSFWFDDAYAGVRRYAAPILEDHGVTAAISVNSNFASRREMFWRAKLSYLSYRDGMRFVRPRLRKYGYAAGQLVRKASMDLFTKEMLADIDAVYERFTTDADRADAFRIFETWDGLRALASKGWTMCNHSASHYPLLETSALPLLAEQFTECERAMQSELGMKSQFWVAPFDRFPKRAADFQSTFDACAEGRTLVLVGHQVNRAYHPGKPISRIGPPADPARLIDVLTKAPVS